MDRKNQTRNVGEVMAEKNQFEVEGFLFQDEKTAEKAGKEAEAVRYIKSKTDRSNPEMVLALYHKVLEQDMFETPVGYAFLVDMQEYLKTIPYIAEEDIAPIPVSERTQWGDETSVSKAEKKPKPKPPKEVKTKTVTKIQKVRTPVSKASVILNALLLVIVVAMFAITFTSNNINILNYETKLQDKYAGWEAELTQREAELVQREKAVSDSQ